jgi:hypothetical protein
LYAGHSLDAEDANVSEWSGAVFTVTVEDASGEVLDVTNDPNLSWVSSCGGSFEDGIFTAPAVNQPVDCTITVTLADAAGATRCTTGVELVIGADRCRRGTGTCGAGCGCTPGSAFGLVIGVLLLAMRFMPFGKQRN